MRACKAPGIHDGWARLCVVALALTMLLATRPSGMFAQRWLTGAEVCALVPPGSYEQLMARDLDPSGRNAACLVLFVVPENAVKVVPTKPAIRVGQVVDAREAMRILEANVSPHSSDTPVTPPGADYGERVLEWINTAYNRTYVVFARGCWIVTADWKVTFPYETPAYDPEPAVRAALAGLDQRLRGAICPGGATGGTVPVGPPIAGTTPTAGSPGVPPVTGGPATSGGSGPTGTPLSDEELEIQVRLAIAGVGDGDQLRARIAKADPVSKTAATRVAQVMGDKLIERFGVARVDLTAEEAKAVRVLEMAAMLATYEQSDGKAVFPSIRPLLPVLGKLAEKGAADPDALLTFQRVVAMAIRLDSQPER